MPKFRVYFERYANVDVEADNQQSAEDKAMFYMHGHVQFATDKILESVESDWEQVDATEEIDENGEVIS